MNADSHMVFHQRFQLPTNPVPARVYTSPKYYDREIEVIFRKDWLWVAREEEIPHVGDYKVKRLAFANTSIILIRGKDRVVRGFHNVCRHRGNKVIPESGHESFGASRGAMMACRFHGWVYAADGRLINVPQQKKFPSCFDKSENGLLPVSTESWKGFIFINLDPAPEKGLLEFLGDIKAHLGDYPFHELTHVHAYYAHLKSNWKVAMDAFAEGYHVPTIHAGSLPGLSGVSVRDVKLSGDHRSMGVYAEGMNPPTPAGVLANSIFDGSIALKQGNKFELPRTINPERSKNFIFDHSIVCPNMMILVGSSLWFTIQMWPVAVDSCVFEGRYYVRAPKTNSEHWALRSAVVLQRNAWLEDTATMEDTQAALQAGVLDKMNLQDDEILVRHEYEVIKRRVGPVEEYA
jgi:phenylpropionate dioxygenase-like ring-hydroxylating dioxygenase large terminal subunit